MVTVQDDEFPDDAWVIVAALLIRRRALAAAAADAERWMVDQDDAGRLVVGVYTPAGVAPDGTVGGSVVASLAYPGDPERRAPACALGAASHMAGLDPPVALELADWMVETVAGGDPAAVAGAARLARRYLRALPDG